MKIKNFPFPLLVTLSILTMLSTLSCEAQRIINKGNLVRIFRNSDGSNTMLKRDAKNTRLEQISYNEKANGEKIVRTRTIYRRDKNGRLRSGIIEDGQRVELFRIVYGYDKHTGRLIAENMYDARVIRRNDPRNPKKETPIRALRYTYNAQGVRSKPIVYSALPGKTAQELKAWLKKYRKGGESTLPDYDPWSKNKR